MLLKSDSIIKVQCKWTYAYDNERKNTVYGYQLYNKAVLVNAKQHT